MAEIDKVVVFIAGARRRDEAFDDAVQGLRLDRMESWTYRQWKVLYDAAGQFVDGRTTTEPKQSEGRDGSLILMARWVRSFSLRRMRSLIGTVPPAHEPIPSDLPKPTLS